MEKFSENQSLLPKSRSFNAKWSSSNLKRFAVVLAILGVGALTLALTLNFTIFSQHQLQPNTQVLADQHGGKTASRFRAAAAEKDYIGPGPYERHSAHGSYLKAAVAADHELCSDIGKNALQKGGSAVDAAIATAVCLGAVNMYTSGLGAAGIMIIYERPKNSTELEMVVLDFLGTTPLAATPDMYAKDPSVKDKGPLSIGVPGEVASYHAAWERFGRLAWADLFTPTINICRDGFKLGRALYEIGVLMNPDIILADPGLREVLTNPDGSFPKEGDVLRLPKLANALERIVKEGTETFYTGSLGREMVADIQDLGGIITMEDLRQYKPIWRTPVSRFIRNGNLTLYGSGVPGAGGFLEFILDVMSEYNYRPGMVDTVEDQVLFLHRMIETWKIGWSQFDRFQDPDFADENILSIISNFETHDFAMDSFKRINDTTAQKFGIYDSSLQAKEHKGSTTTFSVYSEDGAAVVVTTTINDFFGSGLRGRRTGIIFNNLMESFSAPGDDSEFADPIVPGKRGTGTITPTLVFDQTPKPVLAIGGSGGVKIVPVLSQVIANTFWFGMSMVDAIDHARIQQKPPPDLVLQHDRFTNQDVLIGLKQRGHTQQEIGTPYMAIVQSIDTRTCDDMTHAYAAPCVHAVSDFRKYGKPAGY